MSALICYCAGGLANRVRPLAAYRTMADDLARDFFFYWQPDQTCGASFTDLFDAPQIERSELGDLSDVKGTLYAKGSSMANMAFCQPREFPPFSAGQRVLPLNAKNLTVDTSHYVTILDNTPKMLDFNKYLSAINEIFLKTKDPYQGIDLSRTLGIHVRMTDFCRNPKISRDYYVEELTRIWKEIRRDQKYNRLEAVYVASDDHAAVEVVHQAVPLPIVEKPFVQTPLRIPGSVDDWKGFDRKASSVQAAVQDIVALSGCACRAGLRQSTFFCLARELALSRVAGKMNAPAKTFKWRDLDRGFEKTLLRTVNESFEKIGGPQDIFFRLRRDSILSRLYARYASLRSG